MGRDTEHPGDTQIRTWVPNNQYAVIRELAAARQVSVSQIVREMIGAGLETDGQRQALDQALHQVTSALDHLERLTFFAAQEAAFAAIVQEKNYEVLGQREAPGNPDEAAAITKRFVGKIQGLVHERIRRALRGPNAVRKEMSRDESDDD
ncbi:ribbon-helix-helix protein, CopG family [Sulfobacillus harzensis]|uniref:Ribbon-helix-helix protein, CopG family n=1 Tax=Sulfobacillus harzensis TaxID=2729629 RepID=A0A7Y0L6U2_9FIRM|nr:ribbon-helix-helix protein, CopG family [Sulfobacillus harzensis]NMP24357.1 ribbon-helix-helix protein, CopG family [Sulfobacillus harzensis]